MATIKEATANAIAFARETLGVERTRDIRVEEIEAATLENGIQVWRITLSMSAPAVADAVNAIGTMAEFNSLFTRLQREYKVFTVAKQSGEVESMKMRQLADA